MYYQINVTETFRERQLALLEEAEDRRLARQLRVTRRGSDTRSAAAATLAFLAALVVVAGIMLVGLSSPAHADTIFTVNSTGDENDLDFPGGVFDNSSDGKCDVDSGAAGDQCTLRAAIQEAKVTAGADTVEFNIPGSGVHTIRPDSPLPLISEAVTIDGYSQPGASANTLATGTNANLLIELDGTNSGASGNIAGLTINASNTVVRGLVINRFVNTDAIAIQPFNLQGVVTNVRVEGNFIGTDPSGTIAQSNRSGVFVFSASENTIGGASPAARNLISGNEHSGIFFYAESSFGYEPATGNRVEGNLIGPERDGISTMSNGTEGVGLEGDEATGTRILSNSIFSNVGLGIDLDDDGVTPNDGDDPSTQQPDPDADAGPNDLQNFPVLSSARTSRRGTTIKATLDSRPGAAYTIQFFSNPSGTDEGARFIGQKSVSVDAVGNASFVFKPKKKVGVGQAITATATNDFSGDTSEFSAPKVVTRAR